LQIAATAIHFVGVFSSNVAFTIRYRSVGIRLNAGPKSQVVLSLSIKSGMHVET
jgi:hypothetical protein